MGGEGMVGRDKRLSSYPHTHTVCWSKLFVVFFVFMLRLCVCLQQDCVLCTASQELRL